MFQMNGQKIMQGEKQFDPLSSRTFGGFDIPMLNLEHSEIKQLQESSVCNEL